MGEATSNGGKDRIPTGAWNVATFRATSELGFSEVFGKAKSRVAEDDGAAVDGVDGFALAKGEASSFANGADFSAIGIFAAGAVSEIFEEEQMILLLDFFKLADIYRKTEGVLKDEDFELVVFFGEGGEAGGGVVGEKVAIFGLLEVNKDRHELSIFDGFKDGVAGKCVDCDMVTFSDSTAGNEAFESERDSGTTRESEAGMGEVGAIAFGQFAFEGGVIVFIAEDKRVAENVAGGVVAGES